MKKIFLKKLLSLALIIISITTFALLSFATLPILPWYSQHDNTVGTTWSRTNLDNLYFPNMGICSTYCTTSNPKCSKTPLYASTSFVDL